MQNFTPAYDVYLSSMLFTKSYQRNTDYECISSTDNFIHFVNDIVFVQSNTMKYTLVSAGLTPSIIRPLQGTRINSQRNLSLHDNSLEQADTHEDCKIDGACLLLFQPCFGIVQL